MSLEGRNVLLTGGSGGIGRALVDLLLAHGARLTVASRTAPRGTGEVTHLAVDLADPRSVDSIGASLAEMPPDILVNLAGVNAFGAFGAMSAERLASLMQVNLVAPMQLVRALLPAMLERGSGHIVNVGSVLGGIGLPYFSAYAASKAGLERFSEALRREIDGRGVVVTHVAPRAVRTPMTAGDIGRFNQRSGNREDTPEHVAALVLDAVRSHRNRLTIGAAERLFVKLNALFPTLVDRAARRSRRQAEHVLFPMLDSPEVTP